MAEILASGSDAYYGFVMPGLLAVALLMLLGGSGDLRPHPVLSAHPVWAGAFLILAAGLFLAAGVVGLVVRLNAPDEVPALHSHDEPPGRSHHHGPTGSAGPE